MTSIKYHIFAGLCFGVFMGVFNFIFSRNISHALIAGAFAGIFFGVSMYLFANSRLVKLQTQIDNPDAEPMIRAGGANRFVKSVASGGMLYLFANKLLFKPHYFNFQNQELTIDIDKIKDVALWNFLGLVPNGLVITTLDEKKEKFVVEERQRWKKEIEKLLNSRLLVN